MVINILTIIVAFLSLVIAICSLIVTYVVYHKNSIADVVIYTQTDPNRPTIINLIVQNIGGGIAKNIRFDTPIGMPRAAYGISKLSEPVKFYESGIFVNGLPILYPNQKMIFTWGQYGGLKEALNGIPLEVSISFYSPVPLQFFKRKFINNIILDPIALEGTDISESSELSMKKSLKEISSSLKKMSS
ncbi:MAG: hypothetical protein RSA22_00435 [Acinetobacter sp.]